MTGWSVYYPARHEVYVRDSPRDRGSVYMAYSTPLTMPYNLHSVTIIQRENSMYILLHTTKNAESALGWRLDTGCDWIVPRVQPLEIPLILLCLSRLNQSVDQIREPLQAFICQLAHASNIFLVIDPKCP